MEIKEQPFISDHLDLVGLQEEDRLEITPLSGRKKEYSVNRTQIDFISENLKGNEKGFAKSVRILGSQKSESFHVRLEQKKVIGRNQSIKNRYLLRVLSGSPVRLNGNYIFESYIERKDIVEIGFNKLCFRAYEQEGFITHQDEIVKNNLRAINSHLPILLEGETGVGKTSLARKIHTASGRTGRFVHINISSFSNNLIESELFGHQKGSFTGATNDKKGAFREADQGTLFIDEIDSLPIEIQTKLLLFLDDYTARPVGGSLDYKVNIRIIFSSGSSLEKLVAKGKMRKDFYFRIKNGHIIKLASLRDNTELVRDFCDTFERSKFVIISNRLVEFYQSLPWPGNYRQLKGHLERKMILSNNKKLDFDEIDEELICQTSEINNLNKEEISSMKDLKEAHAMKIFLKCNKNYTHASEILGISARSLRSMISNQVF